MRVVSLLALCASVPVWRWMGLLWREPGVARAGYRSASQAACWTARQGVACQAEPETTGVSAPGRRERGAPALVPVAGELEIVALAGHPGGDEADARPPVEPLPAVGQRDGPRARRSGEARRRPRPRRGAGAPDELAAWRGSSVTRPVTS